VLAIDRSIDSHPLDLLVIGSIGLISSRWTNMLAIDRSVDRFSLDGSARDPIDGVDQLSMDESARDRSTGGSARDRIV
jgi:hypothetical protein